MSYAAHRLTRPAVLSVEATSMEELQELAAPPRTWVGRRSAVTTAVSAVLHLVVLSLLATATVRIADPDRHVIPLVIRDPAPLPLPGPPTAPVLGSPAPVVAPVPPPRPVPAVKPRPNVEARSAPKPRIAARPKPAVEKPMPPPVAVAPAPAPPPAAAAPEVGSGVGGAMGATGGAPDGKPGGRRGGRGDDVFRPDQVAVAPAVVNAVQPVYPAIARARGQQGVVIVQAIIGRSGDIEDDSLAVLQSQPPFDDAALAAFRRWRFRPGRDDSGSAVRVIVQQPIRFQLR